MFIKCLKCNIQFKTYPSRLKIGWGKYCSKKCRTDSSKGKKTWIVGKTKKIFSQLSNSGVKKGNIPWNKGKKGFKANEENAMWKGDNVSYEGLHQWVARKRGRPYLCENCGTVKSKKFDWANKSHEYRRDLTDWIRLCRSCHIKYDNSYREKILQKSLI